LRPIRIPPHAHRRLAERHGERAQIADRIREADRQGTRGVAALKSEMYALTIIAEFRQKQIIVKTILQPEWPLYPGTQVVTA